MANPVLSGEPSKQQAAAASQHLALELICTDRSAAWVRLYGELDLKSAQQLAETVEQALTTARLVTIGLRDLTLIDSRGMNELINVNARARHNGRRVVIDRVVRMVDRVLDLVSHSEEVELMEF